MKTFSQYKNLYESELLLEAFKSNKLREFVKDLKELRSVSGYTDSFNSLPAGVMWDQVPDSCVICGESGDINIDKYKTNTKYIVIWYPIITTETEQGRGRHYEYTRFESGESFIVTSGKKCISYTPEKMSNEKGTTLYNFNGTSSARDWGQYVDNKYNALYIKSLLQGDIPCLVLIIKKEDIVKYSSYKKMMDRKDAKAFANDSNRGVGEYDKQVKIENLIKYKTALGNSAADKIARKVVNNACDLITEFDNFIKEHDADKPSTLPADMSKFFNNPDNMDLKKFANIFMVDGIPNVEGADPAYIEKFKFYKESAMVNRSSLINSIKSLIRIIDRSRNNKVSLDKNEWYRQDAKSNAEYYSRECDKYYTQLKDDFAQLKKLVSDYE